MRLIPDSRCAAPTGAAVLMTIHYINFYEVAQLDRAEQKSAKIGAVVIEKAPANPLDEKVTFSVLWRA